VASEANEVAHVFDVECLMGRYHRSLGEPINVPDPAAAVVEAHCRRER
jgi:hypothetical protein